MTKTRAISLTCRLLLSIPVSQDVDLDNDGKLNLDEFQSCVKDQLRLWKHDQESTAACVIS